MRTVKYNPHPESYISATHYEFDLNAYLLTVSFTRHRLGYVEIGIGYNHATHDFTLSALWFGITINIMKRP